MDVRFLLLCGDNWLLLTLTIAHQLGVYALCCHKTLAALDRYLEVSDEDLQDGVNTLKFRAY
ncbi:hypothetical protein [Nostoc sp. FACHB-133]|uniref:hypothetical protein n=1 Tax=Nostoc sp. FACHB-133 TaxID=2692835 RepID=UPI001684F1C0|nr:hypothetical protein [Nostoc sp. FACHB-133]MBD2526793.1 hypothetical protein [Nostoc sp. FACHB-133]